MTVYNMPRWLRQYTVHKTTARIEKQTASMENPNGVDLVGNSKNIMETISNVTSNLKASSKK